MTLPASRQHHALRAISIFLGTAIAVGAAVTLCAVLLADAIAREDLLDGAEETAIQVQQALVTTLTEGSGVDGQDLFAPVLFPHVQAGTLERVKVWERVDESRLRLVYSDNPELIGHEKELRPDRAAILGTAGALVLTVPNDAEHSSEFRVDRQLIEVFTAFSWGEREYLLESYFLSGAEQRAARLRAHFVPVLLGGMILFAAAVLPLALSLARRLSQVERERSSLVLRATAERERERVRLSQHLHDGVVQDLAGASHALTAIAATSSADPARLDAVATVLRQDIASLRNLLNGMVPVDLQWGDLESALRDVVDPAAVDLSIDVSGRPRADDAQTALLFRCARELLMNAVRHAEADRIVVRAYCTAEDAFLSVEDDGRGFDPAADPGDGHLGLRIVEHTLDAAGGRIDVRSSPGAGTAVSLSAPRRTK